MDGCHNYAGSDGSLSIVFTIMWCGCRRVGFILLLFKLDFGMQS